MEAEQRRSNRQMCEKALDLGGPAFARVPVAVRADVSTDTRNVDLLAAVGHAEAPHAIANHGDERGLAGLGSGHGS